MSSSNTQLLDVHNPYDGSRVGQVPLSDAAGLDQAIATAHEAFAKTSKQPQHERADLLLRVAEMLRARKDELANQIVAEAGKPIVMAEGEVARAIITFTDASHEARKWDGEVFDAAAFAPGAGHIGISKRFPLGVVYGMTPFNFPINLVVHKIAPAMACGASIVIKPSPRTPLGSFSLQKIINECGAIPGQVVVAVCPNEIASKPIDDPRIKVVSFTGSVPIGWKIKQQALKKKVTLELGGNAAVIVHEDADLDAAIPMIATGAFGYAGQSCISVQRIIVHKTIYESFRTRFVNHVKTKVKSGDPKSRDVLIGPMISRETHDRVLSLIGNAEKHGASVLAGGVAAGNCIEATVLENVPADHTLCAEEAFAPIAVVIPYDSFEDAIKIANNSNYGMQAGVFTRDIGRIIGAFHGVEVGGVLINQVPTFRIDNLPYGGVKDSGFGREGVRWAIEDMTELRTLVIRQG